jgi:hypothetical protein
MSVDSDVEVIKAAVERIELSITSIFSTLEGKDGVVTKTEVNESSIEDNKSAINWLRGFVATLILFVMGIIIKSLL